MGSLASRACSCKVGINSYSISIKKEDDPVTLHEHVEIYLESVEEGDVLRHCRIGSHNKRKMITDVTIDHCEFLFHDFFKMEMMDSTISNCDLSNARFERSILYRNTFEVCKLIGSDFQQVAAKGSVFRSCQLTYAAFPDAKLTDVAFVDCQLNDSFFMNATISSTTFKRTAIDNADFSESRLAGVDLSDCDFRFIRFDRHLCDGLTIRAAQAASICGTFGIRIAEDEEHGSSAY